MNTRDTQHILDELKTIDQFSHQQALAKVNQKISAQEHKRSRRRLYTFGSSIAAAAIIALVVWMQINPLTITNTGNSTLTHILPDGSSVSLNKDAQLKYRKNIETKRAVQLTGEAFFDIVPDSSHPFTISVGASTVRVLGTSFNVRHSQETENVEVFVKTGKVRLSNHSNTSLDLTPSQLGVVDNSQLKRLTTQDTNYMAWLDHKLTFNNNELAYIIKTVENSYHTTIIIDDQSLLSSRLTTTFHQLSIEEIITSICLTLNLQYNESHNAYSLSQK